MFIIVEEKFLYYLKSYFVVLFRMQTKAWPLVGMSLGIIVLAIREIKNLGKTLQCKENIHTGIWSMP